MESATLPGARVAYGTLEGLAELAETVTAGPALILLGDVLAERVAALVPAAKRRERAA